MEDSHVPIYEYQCSNCSEIFEAFQKVSDDPLTECKFCRGNVEKLISQSSFQLKGTGWYLTDYARNKGESSETDKPKTKTAESTEKGSEKTKTTTKTKTTDGKK